MRSQCASAGRFAADDRAPVSIHVAIVEDDPCVLDLLTKAVSAAADMRLTATAVTRAQALAMLEGPPADALLVDLDLPDGSGIDVIEAAAGQWPACNIMVSTTFADESHVMRSIEAGATGYLLKDGSSGNIVDEIRSLASGGSPLSPIVARLLLARFRRNVACARVGATDEQLAVAPSLLLSAREQEVLDLITKGFTTPEIAKLMQLSRFTIRTFVRRIYSKLKVNSKAEAIYEARTLGLLAS